MLFRCKNCSGNVVYSPELHKMYCPYCEGTDTEETVQVPNVVSCVNCGGEIQVDSFASASRCAYCGSYMIFDERVNGEFTPHLILPFQVGKETVKELIKKEFGKKLFAPDDFLSEAKLSQIEGMYVPFWVYDYSTNYDYKGKGTKLRVWRTGNREYTETSFYNVNRNMSADFSKVPVDASLRMEDNTMDLMEPYDYEALEAFQEKYMSGFYGERYNYKAEQMAPRAEQKVRNDAEDLMKQSLAGYSTLTPTSKNLIVNKRQEQFALMPVWTYIYRYGNKTYPFQINGQTGKVVGQVPFSNKKAFTYTTTVFVLTILGCWLVNGILGVL